jgi:hypothetical protein
VRCALFLLRATPRRGPHCTIVFLSRPQVKVRTEQTLPIVLKAVKSIFIDYAKKPADKRDYIQKVSSFRTLSICCCFHLSR